jgi:flagellar biosynthesis protein
MSDADESEDAKKRRAIAVAVGYEPRRADAPKVVASGKGAVAEQILEIAFAHGVKVREDSDLAELLSAVDIDTEIPLEAFAAVAEILVYVYRANGAMPPPAGNGAPPGSFSGLLGKEAAP